MSEPVTDKYEQYWQINLRLTAWLLVLWLIVTFGSTYFADTLNQITFLGFPLGYYMASQGALIFFLGIIWFYARYMNDLDQEYGVHEGEDD